MRRTVIALLLVSGAAAAVAQPAKQNASAQAPQKHHCAVGVISTLGEKFRVGNRVVPVEWHIDDLVVERIRGAFGMRAVVQRIPYREDVEAEVNRSVPWIPLGAHFKELLRRLTTGTRCARYVVVSVSSDSSNRVGLGIEPSIFTGPILHALIELSVYDGETFERLGRGTNDYGVRTPTGQVRSIRYVDPSLLPDPPSAVLAWLDPARNTSFARLIAQNAKLREATRELVARNLDAMLPQLPLTP